MRPNCCFQTVRPEAASAARTIKSANGSKDHRTIKEDGIAVHLIAVRPRNEDFPDRLSRRRVKTVHATKPIAKE